MDSIAAHLRGSIEAWAESLRRESPLTTLARSGQFMPQGLALYLESLRYLFQQSELNLVRAAERSNALGLDELADYFLVKSREEKGHDGWAANDLAQLPRTVACGLQPAPAARRLVELQRELIEQHPLCFAAYALWAEYFTVLLGDEWLDALSAGGYARTQVTAIAKHVEADRDHAAVGFSELERLWHGEPRAELIFSAVERAQGTFEAFCQEIYQVASHAA
jgi:hypothetical protein